MITHNDIRCVEMRRQELLKQAERDHLANLAVADRPRRQRITIGALKAIGRLFVNWGYRLQGQSEAGQAVPPMQVKEMKHAA